MRYGRATLLAALSGVAACAPTQPEQLSEVTYVCADGRRVVAAFDEPFDQVLVEVEGRRLTLPQVGAASGARYALGDVAFWTKPGEARLETSRGVTTCRVAG